MSSSDEEEYESSSSSGEEEEEQENASSDEEQEEDDEEAPAEEAPEREGMLGDIGVQGIGVVVVEAERGAIPSLGELTCSFFIEYSGAVVV